MTDLPNFDAIRDDAELTDRSRFAGPEVSDLPPDNVRLGVDRRCGKVFNRIMTRQEELNAKVTAARVIPAEAKLAKARTLIPGSMFRHIDHNVTVATISKRDQGQYTVTTTDGESMRIHGGEQMFVWGAR